jgi:hypothetical protein
MNIDVFTKGRAGKYDAQSVFDGKGIVVKKEV